MNRREWLYSLAGLFAVDPEKLLWVPKQKTIFIPKPSGTMNLFIKKKWVAALRSGKYHQTVGFLHDADGYCCLGVLCELAVQENVIPYPVDQVVSESGSAAGIWQYVGEEAVLPKEVRMWAGLPMSQGAHVIIYGNKADLTSQNDDGMSFLEIAKAIEEQL